MSNIISANLTVKTLNALTGILASNVTSPATIATWDTIFKLNMSN